MGGVDGPPFLGATIAPTPLSEGLLAHRDCSSVPNLPPSTSMWWFRWKRPGENSFNRPVWPQSERRWPRVWQGPPLRGRSRIRPPSISTRSSRPLCATSVAAPRMRVDGCCSLGAIRFCKALSGWPPAWQFPPLREAWGPRPSGATAPARRRNSASTCARPSTALRPGCGSSPTTTSPRAHCRRAGCPPNGLGTRR